MGFSGLGGRHALCSVVGMAREKSKELGFSVNGLAFSVVKVSCEWEFDMVHVGYCLRIVGDSMAYDFPLSSHVRTDVDEFGQRDWDRPRELFRDVETCFVAEAHIPGSAYAAIGGGLLNDLVRPNELEELESEVVDEIMQIAEEYFYERD